MNFELVPNRLGDLVPHLKAGAPDLFKLPAVQAMEDLPQVTLSAFASWLAEQNDPSALIAGVELIDQLLAWESSEVTEAVEDGFFAPLKDNCSIGRVLIPAMSPRCSSAYGRWSERDDGG